MVGVLYLARLFVSEWTSLGTAVLFGTQPLLFGHRFINPKDSPLAAVFLLAVTAGFYMVDRWKDFQSERPVHADRRLLIYLAVIAIILWSKNAVTGMIMKIVDLIYSGDSSSGFQTLVSMQIEDIYRWLCLAALLLVTFLFILRHRKAGPDQRINMQLLLAAGLWGFAVSTRIIAVAAGGIVGLYALLRYLQRS